MIHNEDKPNMFLSLPRPDEASNALPGIEPKEPSANGFIASTAVG